VLWAHNAHVVGGRPPSNKSGAILRDTFGCGYRAAALTFGAGDFLAQVANDPKQGFAVTTLPEAEAESIDGVLALVQHAGLFASWPCREATGVPAWLAADRPLHWVGAIWRPGTAPDLATQPYSLLRDFDAVLYFPHVTAETSPSSSH
jgi:erythromycin esterase-like protein